MAGIITKKGDYTNVNIKNLNATHSMVATVNSARDITTQYGESTLFNLYVHRVLDAEGELYDQIDVEAGMFIGHNTKYTQELLSFLNDNVGNTVVVKLERIEPRTYNIPNKAGGTTEKMVYTPVYSMRIAEDVKAAQSSEKDSLPMPKGVFVQLAKASGIEYDGVLSVQGKDYKVSDYVSKDEYSG